MSTREIVTTVHGMVLGGLFLLCFTGGVVVLQGLDNQTLTTAGISKCVRLAQGWTLLQALLAWLTTLVGALVVYPWYRATPVGADLSAYPQALLMANQNIAFWHNFGMEWKEHVAWFAPILATVVCYLTLKFGPAIAQRKDLRVCCITLSSLAFAGAAIGGLLGAEITKAAPIR